MPDALSNELAQIAARLLADRQCGDCGARIHDWTTAVAHANSDGFACDDHVTRQGPRGCSGCPHLSEEGLCTHPAVADRNDALGERIRALFDSDDTGDCPGRKASEENPLAVAEALGATSWWTAGFAQSMQTAGWKWGGDGSTWIRVLQGPMGGARCVWREGRRRPSGFWLPDLSDMGTAGVLLGELSRLGGLRLDREPHGEDLGVTIAKALLAALQHTTGGRT